MNDKQIKILVLLIICIIITTSSIIYLNVSYSNLNLQNNKTTNSINLTKTTQKITQENNNTTNKINTTKVYNKTTKKTDIITKKTTMKITTESNENDNDVNEEILKKMYYYRWTKEDDRDYTGRNCLFIYDINGKITEGYANVIYYGKYRKKQYISNDISNCFLEDMYSTKVESIIVDGVKYE